MTTSEYLFEEEEEELSDFNIDLIDIEGEDFDMENE